MKTYVQSLAWALILFFAFSCGSYSDVDGYDGSMDGSFSPEGSVSEGRDSISYESGILTAAEWNDLGNWDFWRNLINDQNDSLSYVSYLQHWAYQTSGRVGLQLTASGKALVNATVILKCQDSLIWSAKTDNKGRAELWLDLNKESLTTDISACDLYVNGMKIAADLQTNTLNTIECLADNETSTRAEIAFVVDATGSMGDEMNFLKEDLMDVLENVKTRNSSIDMFTAAVFYRDEGDDYVVKHDGFTDNTGNTINYIKKQSAGGGGDYPEAVHKALGTASSLQWSSKARARIVFLLLDAPAHHDPKILDSLHASIRLFAAQGVKVIPVAASGVDKSTEFMLRYFAMSTCGTYVFLTDDSGVGNPHIKPSVGEYQVQPLNSLLQSLILEYTE